MKKIVTYSIIGFIISGVFFGSIFYFAFFKDRQPAVQVVKTYEYSLAPFSTNLSNIRSYFKGTIVLETTNKKLVPKFDEKNAEIRDSIIKILISKKPDELLDTNGLQNLRKEITQTVNKVMDSSDITNVYFIDYIIQ